MASGWLVENAKIKSETLMVCSLRKYLVARGLDKVVGKMNSKWGFWCVELGGGRGAMPYA